MIKVKVRRNDNGTISSFEMSGHAESGPYGHDLVCAGASAVSFGALNAVMSLLDTDLEVSQGEDGGFLRCVVPETDRDTDEKVQLLLEGMLVSLQTIENDYGKYITIKDSRR